MKKMMEILIEAQVADSFSQQQVQLLKKMIDVEMKNTIQDMTSKKRNQNFINDLHQYYHKSMQQFDSIIRGKDFILVKDLLKIGSDRGSDPFISFAMTRIAQDGELMFYFSAQERNEMQNMLQIYHNAIRY